MHLHTESINIIASHINSLWTSYKLSIAISIRDSIIPSEWVYLNAPLDTQETWLPSLRSEAQASGCMYSTFLQHCSYASLYYVANIFFIIECGIVHFICAMRVRSSGIILIPRLPLCQISFLSYSITHSLNHPTYLMPREPKLALWNNRSLRRQVLLGNRPHWCWQPNS